jgi:hypothetical protein
MESQFRFLSRQAFNKHQKGGAFALQGQGRKRAYAYLQQCDAFIELLFAAIHLTSSMPARGEELRVLR